MITPETAIAKIQKLPPDQLNQVMIFIEFLEFKTNISPVEANNTQTNQNNISFAQAAQDFIGCLDSDLEDLSYNPQYLEGFGK